MNPNDRARPKVLAAFQAAPEIEALRWGSGKLSLRTWISSPAEYTGRLIVSDVVAKPLWAVRVPASEFEATEISKVWYECTYKPAIGAMYSEAPAGWYARWRDYGTEGV